MTDLLTTAFEYIDAHEQEMIDLLSTIGSMESPAMDFNAVANVAEYLNERCREASLTSEVHAFASGGPSLTACTAEAQLPPVALLGHMDTVHLVGSFGEQPVRIEGDMIYGPGVFDMKGGVVIALMCIRALMHAGYDKRQLKMIIAGDEEVAHSATKGEGGKLMEECTKDCAAVFNCESGSPNAGVTVRRKGGAVFEVRVYGKAAHSGKEPQKGASAIRQAAEMICAIERETDFASLSYNCGKISGGKGSNIIPDYCEFTVGIRYVTNAQYEHAEKFLQELCENPVVAGTHCEMNLNGFYPAMEPVEKTEALLDVYKQACALLGFAEPEPVSQGGCSDSAFVTKQGIPALCSLGIQGDGAHAKTECARLSSLAEQCKKLAAAIVLLPDQF